MHDKDKTSFLEHISFAIHAHYFIRIRSVLGRTEWKIENYHWNIWCVIYVGQYIYRLFLTSLTLVQLSGSFIRKVLAKLSVRDRVLKYRVCQKSEPTWQKLRGSKACISQFMVIVWKASFSLYCCNKTTQKACILYPDRLEFISAMLFYCIQGNCFTKFAFNYCQK